MKILLLSGNFAGSFDEFFELYKSKRLFYGDPIEWFQGYWQLKNQPNIHIVFYEDLKADQGKEIMRLSDFLGKPLKDKEMENILEHTTFTNMQNNSMVNCGANPFFKQEVSKFIRRGVVGDWKQHFTDEQVAIVDKEILEKLKGTGQESRMLGSIPEVTH